jgi:pimeloyl-ACP methyl ester carboxylesterase
LLYSAIAQEVASKGFTVVTIDHPYDAGIVVFPDNSTIVGGNISTGGQLLENLDVRVLDASFVLDSLSNTSIADSLIPGVGKDGIDVDNVGFFGHSFGGATAAQAMLRDQRLKGGVNLDGSFFGTVIQDGLERPFIIFANEVHNTTDDPSWAAIWPKLKGWKRELILEGSVHGTFTDFPDIVDVLGLKGKLPPEAGQVLGSIDGARVLEILGEYVGGFFEFVLKGRKVGLLDGPSERFPEIEFGHPDA